ncbi:MAG: glycerophosphodiester phosphodiesterase family protein [Hyphomicrobiaceae bacterium]
MTPHPADRKAPKIASHRGGADLWPENSMTAFRETAVLDVDQVEFDVHPTVDGELVVHHDPTIDRMTDGSGAISKLTFSALSKLTIKGTAADRIPALSDVLDLYRPTPIDLRLEIKADANRFRYPDLEAAIAAVLVQHELQHRTTVTSFWIDTLLSFHACLPAVPLIWLVDRSIVRQIGDLDGVLRIAARRGVREIALHESDLGEEECRLADAVGLVLGAYAVNDAMSIQRMFDLGVTVFTTNRPDLALQERSERARR